MFKKIVTSAIFVVAAMSLTGCKEKKDEAYYLSHHDELLIKYSECLNNRAWQTESCAPVSDASKQLSNDPEMKAAFSKIERDFMKSAMKDVTFPGVNSNKPKG